MTIWKRRLNDRQLIGLGGAVLLALGAAGGAAAVSYTRPTIEMAPTIPTAMSHLATTSGVVTVRGRVAAVYGDRFLIQDQSGRALVDAGHGGASALAVGSPIQVQGRFDDGQLRARFLVDAVGHIDDIGPRRPPHGGRDAGPPRGGPGGLPPPPPGGPDASPPATPDGAVRPAAGLAPDATGPHMRR